MALDLSPPFEGAFASYESLFSSLQEHAKAHGYAVAIGNSRQDRAGILSTQYIHCVKAGAPRNRVTDCQKPFISQKTNCPFKCKVRLTSKYPNANEADEENWEL